MNYETKWHPQAAKKLGRLPKELIKRVLEKFDEVEQDPFRFLEHFEGQKVYKLRIGDYRVLIDIDYKNHVLYVQHFDHRKKVYKK